MTRKEALKELNNYECLYHPELGYSVMMEANDNICCFEIISVINGECGRKKDEFIPFDEFIESIIHLEEGWIRFS